MGFCSCINKFFLIMLNLIIFAVGIGVIALASVVIHKGSQYGQLLFEGIFTLPVCTLIVGIIITMIGFLGCFGAMRENSCMLYTYASIVTILFIAEVVLGILVAVYPEKAETHIKKALDSAFSKYGQEDKSLTATIDSVQHDLQCCGVESYMYWETTSVPKSCCKDPANCTGPSDYFSEGCYEAIKDDMKGVTVALGITAIVLAVVQVFSIGIACALARKRSQYV